MIKIAPINMFILAVESFKADDLLKQYCKVENREEEGLGYWPRFSQNSF
jgi:hypothetical protein